MERLKPVRRGEKLWRAMLEKRTTESGRRVYSRRKVIAESAFG